jgi:hypothetical protein
MPVVARSLGLVAVLALTQLIGADVVVAQTDSPLTECSVEVQTPSIPLGAQARYVVHLSGGNGSYSISFAYGDGWSDGSSVTGSQSTFAHWFQSTGNFTQSVTVMSAGSSATCGGQTVVW